MLCCVSKRAVAGSDQGSPYDDCSTGLQSVGLKKIKVDKCTEKDVPPILLPCAICARTFMPQSLEKHSRICERSITKKRKPFDSAKQRIQGTDLAEFLPKQEKKRNFQEDSRVSNKPTSAWKQTHDDFLRAIRAARSEIVESTPQKQCNSTVSTGAPTRAHEQGMCPTCNRHFGIKAYERHVAWCKEKVNRVQLSPATNIAKERLEARMRYRAPALKNRRPTNREKYSPGSAVTLTPGNKTSPTLSANKTKESISVPSCNKGNVSPIKQRPAILRRPGQHKESPSPAGPMKSRLIDRTNRLPEDEPCPVSVPSVLPVKRTSHLPVPPLKTKKGSLEDCGNDIASPISYIKQPCKIEEKLPRCEISYRGKMKENKNQSVNSARSQKTNIVSARSQGNPKLNDVTINVDVLGMTVQPCMIHKEQLITWKQISGGKSLRTEKNKKNRNVPEHPKDTHLSDYDSKSMEEFCLKEKELEDYITSSEKNCEDDTCKLSQERENITWPVETQNLNQTYLIRDSTDTELDDADIATNKKWKPVKHSPRIEFFLRTPEEYTSYSDSLFNIHNLTVSTTDVEIDKTSKNSKEINIETDSPEYLEEKNQTGGNIENQNSEEEMISERQLLEDSLSEQKSLEFLESPKINSPLESASSPKSLDKNPLILETEEHITQNINFQDSDPHEDFSFTEETSRHDELNGNVFTEENDKLLLGSETVEIISKSHDDVEQTDTTEHAECSDELNEYFEVQDTANSDVNVNNRTPESHINKSEIKNKGEDTANSDVNVNNRTPESQINKSEINNKGEDINSAMQGASEYLHNQTECLIKNDVNNEPDEVELESDKFFSNDILRPAGSSTPLEDTELFDLEGNSKVVPPSPSTSSKWKFTLEEDTGVEILHRVESFGSNDETVIKRINSETQNGEKLLTKDSADITCQENICEDCLNMQSDLYISNGSLIKGQQQKSDRSFEMEAPLRREERDHCSENEDQIFEQYENTIMDHFSREQDELNVVVETIVEIKNAIDKKVPEIYESYINKDFNYDSDHTVEENSTQNVQPTMPSNSSVTFQKPLKNQPPKSRLRPYNTTNIDQKIRKNMNVLRNSTDSLISSLETVDLANIRQVDSVEIETIEEIGTKNRSVKFRILPKIKGSSVVVVRENYSKKQKIDSETYWEKASKAARNRLINLDPPNQGEVIVPKKNPKIRTLPPIPSGSPLIKYRNLKLPLRPVWSSYVRRRPDFNLVLSGRTGKDYDPFLLAEQQMNDLSDISDLSVTDGPSLGQNRDTSFPLSHSSAFVKYPYQSTHSSPDKRSSLIAPPSEFDDLASDFSSDSTETNSLSREVFLKDLQIKKQVKDPVLRSDAEKKSPTRELGRRVIIDKSKALGGDILSEDTNRGSRSFVGSTERTRKILDKVSPKVVRPAVNRSHSVRASSAPKTTPEGKAWNNCSNSKKSAPRNCEAQRSLNTSLNNQNNNNYVNLTGSNLSLSSIVSSEVDIKRSNSVFDELMTSFEDDADSFPSLRSFLKHDSLSISSPIHGRPRNGQISDEELSSPESYKRQDHSKLSADSAYSSLNRKYSNHGRSTNDVAGRHEEDPSRNNRRDGDAISSPTAKCKMSKYCHECGSKFTETAKFCCECGIRRLAL